MKKMLVLGLALMMGLGVCMAQTEKPAKKPTKQMTTTVFSTNLDCPNCAKKVETNVPVLGKGIQNLSIDPKTFDVTVTYDAAKNNDENIIKGMEKLKVEAKVKK
ncbi:MAG: heavy-metal-associated domain-containing protein [Alistipes sp.]|nr:heavy-metal-associated domain-containing protein [Alistipes sp.]